MNWNVLPKTLTVRFQRYAFLLYRQDNALYHHLPHSLTTPRLCALWLDLTKYYFSSNNLKTSKRSISIVKSEWQYPYFKRCNLKSRKAKVKQSKNKFQQKTTFLKYRHKSNLKKKLFFFSSQIIWKPKMLPTTRLSMAWKQERKRRSLVHATHPLKNPFILVATANK